MKGKNVSLIEIKQRNTRKVAALFLAPVTILMVVFIFYPIIDTFITSGYIRYDNIIISDIKIEEGNTGKLFLIAKREGENWRQLGLAA